MMTYAEYLEPDLPPISFFQIIKNPVAIVFYLFCLYILIGWIIYSIKSFKTCP